jgi:uncharacterized protein DUF4339
MKYYYLNGSEKRGPFSLDELKKQDIDDNTFIWYDSLSEWKKLKELDNLKKKLLFPPPIPNEVQNTNKENDDNKILSNSNTLKPTKKQLAFYIIWVVVLVVLFLLTKTDNDSIQRHHADVEKFWPFTVEFYAGKNHTAPGLKYNCQKLNYHSGEPEPCFNGVLADYDISEVVIYSLTPVIIFVLIGLLKNNSDSK